MKKVAGRLKIELSQYRDLEAFAQFGSDLDADTQRTLARGERLVKTLNQNERSPLPVEDQVVQVYAATNGFLDRIDADQRAGVPRRPHRSACAPRTPDAAREDRRRRLVRRDAGGARRARSREFADDFGYDLDEEGQPLRRATRPRRRAAAGGARRATPSDDGDEAEPRGRRARTRGGGRRRAA